MCARSPRCDLHGERFRAPGLAHDEHGELVQDAHNDDEEVFGQGVVESNAVLERHVRREAPLQLLEHRRKRAAFAEKRRFQIHPPAEEEKNKFPKQE